MKCPDCNGSGTIVLFTSSTPCTACSGQGSRQPQGIVEIMDFLDALQSPEQRAVLDAAWQRIQKKTIGGDAR